MKEIDGTQTFQSVPPPTEDGISDNAAQTMMSVSGQMVLLTWVTFAVVALALHRLLWKPLLRILENREHEIRDALEEADRAREKVAECDIQKHRILEQADTEAKAKADRARQETEKLRNQTLQTTRQEAAARLQEVEKQIAIKVAQAETAVRAAAMEDLCATLERVLAQELTDEQRKCYQQAMLREMKR